MKTLINNSNPQIRITAPEITTAHPPVSNEGYVYWIPAINQMYSPIDWTLVDEVPTCKETLQVEPLEGIKGNLEEIPSNVDLEEDYHWEGLVQLLRDYQKTIDRSSNNMAYESVECYIDWLKSLRPQPRKEIYQAAKHDLAIRFMNYLDENRPEGKMSLSNGECEDIDKAFRKNDWAKIMRYAEKYQNSLAIEKQ